MKHPGRVALLRRAADLRADVDSRERDTLIALGAPGHDREHVLTVLKCYADLWAARKPFEAQEALRTLTETEPPPTEGDAA